MAGRSSPAAAIQVIKLWDAFTRQELHSFRGHKNWVTSVAFSNDGYFILSASVDKTLQLWELGGRESAPGYGHSREVRALAVSPDGKLIASGSSDRTVRVWEAATGKELYILIGHTDPITAVAFLSDSKSLVSTAEDKVLKVWSMANGKELRTIRDPGPSNEVPVLQALPDGKSVAAWVATALVETYDAAAGKQVMEPRCRCMNGRSRSPACRSAPMATVAALGCQDGSVRLWSVSKKTRCRAAICRPMLRPSWTWRVTPDKQTLITTDKFGEIKIWDLNKRQAALHTFQGHKERVSVMAVSPKGDRFVTAGHDNVVKLWSVAGKELRQWDLKMPPLANRNRPFVKAIVFSPDGKYVITGNANTTLYMLECP